MGKTVSCTRWAATACLAASIASMAAACGTASTARRVDIELDQPFAVRVGDTASWGAGLLQVSLEAVPTDSRCPKGVQCVWAGGATARFSVRHGGATQVHELHTAPNTVPGMRVGDLELRLIDVTPYPVAGKAIAKDAYVAQFTLSRSTASTAPDR